MHAFLFQAADFQYNSFKMAKISKNPQNILLSSNTVYWNDFKKLGKESIYHTICQNPGERDDRATKTCPFLRPLVIKAKQRQIQ